MSQKQYQVISQIGLTLLVALALLVVWVLFLEDLILGTVLGQTLTRTELDKWEFVIGCLTLIGLTLILPFKNLKKLLDQLNQTQQALAGERTLSRAFFHADNSILIVTDISHRISQINHKATQLLGYRENELLGKEWVTTLVSENSRAQVKKNLQLLLHDRTKSSLNFPATVLTKDRRERVVEWQSAPLTDERGMVCGTINSGNDVTEEKRLTRELRNTINRYEPQLKKLAADLTESKKKSQQEAIKNAQARAKFQFWMDLDTILFSMTEEQKQNPVEVDGRVHLIIQRYGEMTQVDNGYIFQFNEDATQMYNTQLWAANDPELKPSPDDEIPLDSFPWLKNKILKKEIIHAKNLEELPEAAKTEKEILQSQGIKSLINVPLIWKNHPVGYIGFETIHKERAWDPDEISMLRILSKVLAQTLLYQAPHPTAETLSGAVPVADETADAQIRQEYEEKLQALQAQLETQQAETRARETELEQTRQQLQQELEQRKISEKDLAEAREKIQQELTDRTTELEQIKSQLENQAGEKHQLAEELQELQTKMDSNSLELETQDQDAAREELETLRQEFQQTQQTLKQELEAKIQEGEALQDQMDMGEETRRQLEAELEEVNQKMSRQNQEHKALELAHTMLQTELEELKKLQQDFDSTLLHLEEKEKSFEDYAKELEEDLEEQKQLVGTLETRIQNFSRVPLPLVTFDSEGTILTWNAGAETALGYPQEDMVGRPLDSLIRQEDETDLSKTLIESLRAEDHAQLETTVVRADGETLPARFHVTALRDEPGGITGGIGYFTFPEPAPAAASLGTVEAATIMGHSGLLVLQLSSHYEVLDLNAGASSLFGWDRREVFEKNFFHLILPPDQARDIQDDVTGVLELKSSSDFECEVTAADNQPHHIFWNLVRQEAENGKSAALTAIGQDLTELRQAEKMLKENESLLNSIVDNSPDGFITIDENGIIQSFNTGAEHIFGYSGQEAVGQNVNMLMPEPYRGEHSNYINNYLVTGKAKLVGMPAREFLGQKKDGTTFPVEVAVREMYQDYRRLFVGIVHDITRRKSIEQSLKESEEKFRKVLAAENDAIVILNAATKRILDANEAAVKMFGYERDELLRLKLNDISTEPEKSLAAGNGGGLGHISRTPLRYHKKKDGTVFPAEVSAGTFMVQNQKLNLRVIRDISESVRLEENLRENQEHLHHILNNTPAAVYIKDADGRYILINRQFETLFRVTHEEIRGKTDHEVFPKDLADEFSQSDRKVLESGAAQESQETVLYSDGAHVFDSVKFPLRNSAGVLYGLCGILSDITQRTRLEEELRNIRGHLEDMVVKRTEELQKIQQKTVRSEKLKATSQLAGVVAHQINNPIHGIRNILEQINERVQMEDIHKNLVGVAIQECMRVAGLLEKLRECHAPKAAEPESLDLNQVIEDAITVNQEKLGDLVTLEKHFAQDLPRLEGYTTQIRQAIEQLIQNAEEALPQHKGRILIATERDQDQVKIHIQDSGCGIPPENLEVIFDPFFTTKTALKRTGLGLLVTLGIVKNHKGDIEVKSQPGKGTTFTITLPVKSSK